MPGDKEAKKKLLTAAMKKKVSSTLSEKLSEGEKASKQDLAIAISEARRGGKKKSRAK